MLRHAERADSAPEGAVGRVAWSRKHDPPLTLRGEAQARLAGMHIARSCEHSFDAVYSSPFARCVQTAAAVAAGVRGRAPVRVVYGLGECAKAYRVSLRGGMGAPEFMTRAELCSAVGSDEVLIGGQSAEDSAAGFVPTIERLARETAGEDAGPLLIVTHREGIHYLDVLSGAKHRFQQPYCNTHEYLYDTETGLWELLHDSSIRRPVLRVKDVRDTHTFAYELQTRDLADAVLPGRI